jgi:riboflavin kinase/FMN adenylyltransferase
VLFTLTGLVVRGERRGTALGFPTANLSLPESTMLPDHGVYACRALLENGSSYPAATNVGVRPMFETRLGELVEAHLVGFTGDLYDQPLTLQVLERLRPEVKFGSVDELVAQIERDVVGTLAACEHEPL